MSGTSLDGVDAAIVRTNGERIHQLGPYLTLAYTPAERKCLQAACEVARSLSEPDPQQPEIVAATEVVTARHAAVVHTLLEQTGLAGEDIDLLGFHGQTVVHRPAEGWTWQLGDAARLAAETGIAVIDDFRSADIDAGGEGAPLAPLYHAALLRSHAADPALRWPVAVLNLGGVANVTWIEDAAPDSCIMAFDTGPGIGLIDDWVRAHTGELFDAGGVIAARGRVEEARAEAMLNRPWFDKAPPKSLDRHDFSLAFVEGLGLEAGTATLVAVTARAVALATRHFPQAPRQWLVAGGGRRNPSVMAALAEGFSVPVHSVDEIGWRGDALEAEAFAFLAGRARYGLPLSLPTTTGAARPVTGGRFWPALG